jgi:hypothetical protein
MAKGFMVEATDTGYYDREIKNAGDRFFIADASAFSDKWMKKVAARSTAVGQQDVEVDYPVASGTDKVEIRTPETGGSNLDTDEDPARNTSPDPKLAADKSVRK